MKRIDIHQVARLIGKSEDTVRRRVRLGLLPPPIERRGWWKWDEDDIKKHLGIGGEGRGR